MEHYAGIDVSLESASICVVDASGRIVREAKVASEPEVLIGWFGGLRIAVARIGLEVGPLSQWLYAGMRDVGLPVELLETRHVRAAFKAMPVKTDRKDARGTAQLMRLGWFRPVHWHAQDPLVCEGPLQAYQVDASDLPSRAAVAVPAAGADTNNGRL
jgi:transposase